MSDNDERDLKIGVDSPQKHVSALETYITFRVTTKTTRSEFENQEYVVRRRYNDFIWLHEKLVQNYPYNIIPPLPEKHSLIAQLDRYSKAFIACRMAFLHRYLNRIADHPLLSCDKNFTLFITAKPSEFSMHRKNRAVISMLSRWSENLTHLPPQLAHLNAKGRPQEFDKSMGYMQALSEKLTDLEKISCTFQKEQEGHLHAIRQLQPIFTLWSASEPDLGPALFGMATALDKIGKAEEDLIKSLPVSVIQPLKEFNLYIGAVQDVLNRRDGAQVAYELAMEESNKKRNEKAQLEEEQRDREESGGSTSSSSREKSSRWLAGGDKLQKLSSAIPDLANKMEEKQDRCECANETLRSDLEHWHTEKKNDLKQLFLSLAEEQIRFHEQSLTAWEELLPTICDSDPITATDLLNSS